MKLDAHARTIWPVLHRYVKAPMAPPSKPWSIEIADPKVGPVRLTGRLRVPSETHPQNGSGASTSTLLLLVHGLGGSSESHYMMNAASVADQLGLASLRLNLRGADGSGEDMYHAGLSEDLTWVLASPRLASFERILLCGFSLGGHLSLRFATQVEDSRLRAVAAVCAPLNIDLSVAAIDQPAGWIYRRYVLSGLSRMYGELAARRELPLSATAARDIRTIREWDRQTIAPRFGFDSPEDYYRQAGVGSRLDQLRVPSLLVAAEQDPMIPRHAIDCDLHRAPAWLHVRWLRRGGHLVFPSDFNLGEDAPIGLAGQLIGWLNRFGR